MGEEEGRDQTACLLEGWEPFELLAPFRWGGADDARGRGRIGGRVGHLGDLGVDGLGEEGGEVGAESGEGPLHARLDRGREEEEDGEEESEEDEDT